LGFIFTGNRLGKEVTCFLLARKMGRITKTNYMLGLSYSVNLAEITSYDLKPKDLFCYAKMPFSKMST